MNKLLLVAYTVPLGRSSTSAVSHTFLPSALSTFAVQTRALAAGSGWGAQGRVWACNGEMLGKTAEQCDGAAQLMRPLYTGRCWHDASS